MGKVFASNPLSLNVPDPAFESWLRESGYLEILDTAATTSATAVTTASTKETATATTLTHSLLHYLYTFISLLTANPFAKLTTDDFSANTPSWTREFIGALGSFSFPSSPHTLKLRVHENVKRYARNYASLFILFFACSLYQMPLALVGLISSLALWDFFKFCSDKWNWDWHPVIRQVLVRIAQCATLVVLMLLNVQMALFCALAISYVGVLFDISMPAVDAQPESKAVTCKSNANCDNPCQSISNAILIPISAFVFLAAIRRVVEEIKACIASSSDILDAE